MAANMLPIIALAAAAFLLTRKKGNSNVALPKNLTLGPVGDFKWGVTVLLGPDITDQKADQVVDIVAKHARKHSALPFEIIKEPTTLGIPVTVWADSLPYEEWAENPSYLDAVLTDLLAAHIPS